MGKKGVGRPRDGNPEETRREILAAAEKSFASAGFVGATTRLVAAAAGVNVATLHYHFGNKEGLYRAVLREAVGGPLPEFHANASPEERLRGVVASLFDHAASRRSLSRLALLDQLAGPRHAPPAVQPSEASQGSTSAVPAASAATADPRVPFVARALAGETGRVRGSADTEFLARWIVGMIDVSFLSAEAADGGHPAPDVRDAVVAAALNVLR